MLTTLNYISHLNVNSHWGQLSNSCLADIRRRMMTNKLKINYLKTEFIVFRYSQLKYDMSGCQSMLVKL